MSKRVFNGLWNSPLKASAFTLAVWAAVTNLLFVIADKVLVSIFMLFLGFGFIYPVSALVLFFRLSKRHGILWYFYAAILAVTSIEFFLVDGFKSISPNIIVMTLLCLIFGCGFGSCFADRELINSEKEQRRKKRLNEDKEYKGILEDTPRRRKK